MITPAGHHLIKMCKCQLETPQQLKEKFQRSGEAITGYIQKLPEQIIVLLGNTPILDK